MKLIYITLSFLVLTVTAYTQNIGFNINTPNHPVHIKQPAGMMLQNEEPLMFVDYSHNLQSQCIGLKAKCKSVDFYGIGGDFEGGFAGLIGRVTGSNIQVYTGLKGDAGGTGSGTFIGTYGFAHGSGMNQGVFGDATGGTTNWAGYFYRGNVYIKNRLGISNDNPLHPVHINQTAGTTLSYGEPVLYTEYTGTNLADVIGIKAKCKPSDYYGVGGDFEGGFIGVQGRISGGLHQTYIGVSGDVGGAGTGDFYGTFGNAHSSGANHGVYGSASGGTTNWAGYFNEGNVYIDNRLGIGRNPLTNHLEINGTASKSSAGDWLANSDARLKKNIEPLDAQNMIEKLLALKGITYEWNDTITENNRPEGVQYGFTAQNIQEVFPTLVSTDANGYLQTAYGTYDAMMVEAIRALYLDWKAQEQKTIQMQQQIDAQAQLYSQLVLEMSSMKKTMEVK